MEGKWFKGNLHVHTTISDGKNSLAQMIAFYKQKGYHFLGVTE